MLTVQHQPSGDWAEAEDSDAAYIAARQLLEDNGWEGTARVFEGQLVRAIVWPPRHGDQAIRCWIAPTRR